MLSPKRLVEKAKKGRFVVYAVDGTRFMVPLAFLKNKVVQELLKLSEEEFGLPGDGPIRLACSGVFMDYVLTLLHKRVSRDVENALLASIDANRCSASLLISHPGRDQRRLVALT